MKINMYYRNGEVVRAHERGKKIRKARKNKINYKERRQKALCLIGIIICSIGFICHGIDTPKPETVQAQVEVVDQPLNGAISFESADMSRDTQAREMRSETVEEIVRRVFGDEAENALKVFKCESNLDPNVIGDTNTKYPSVGVAQIRMLPERNLKVADMLDATKNIEYAKMLFDKSQWKPWSCRGVIK